MKKLISVLALTLSMSAMAVEVKTSITCQQEDGDQWIETGIVSGRTNTALLVEHDADLGARLGKLVATETVYQKVQGNKTVIFNAQGTYSLTIYKRGSMLLGDLVILGRKAIVQKGMYCYPNSSISFRK